ncbi:MAG: hypothetical protein AAGA54_34845 [Myxococcota bacterium]
MKPGTGPSPDPSTTAGDEGSDELTSNDDGGQAFLGNLDIPDDRECWILGEGRDEPRTCPKGFKCMPYANDGGSSWNAHTCAPLSDDPKHPGEPCVVEGSGVSGLDNCDATSMCWDVDGRTLEGECVAFCGGTAPAPSCPDENSYCSIGADGYLPLCFPTCDPVAQDCPEGEGCYPFNDAFICAADASGEGGNADDPCEYINGCTPGNACLSPTHPEQCKSSYRCCAPFCDVDAPDCPRGTVCESWFDSGEVPEHPNAIGTGVCIPSP